MAEGPFVVGSALLLVGIVLQMITSAIQTFNANPWGWLLILVGIVVIGAGILDILR